MNIADFSQTLNRLGKSATPFIFFVDFEMKKPCVLTLEEVNANELLYDFNGITNAMPWCGNDQVVRLQVLTTLEDEYAHKYKIVNEELKKGNSFLINLTVKTEITLTHSLKDIFYASKAKYKLWCKDEFVLFSPESFVCIKDKKIKSYPMKGTIDASIPDAENQLLGNKKEMAEHVTIVDLIRSDLSRVATDIHLRKFRYVDKLVTNRKTLLQASSEIEGRLPDDYCEDIGSILTALLPAGSVSGAPKTKTLEIIRMVEGEERGYYTGVCGYFDGEEMDSGVMIGYIEKTNNRFYYRSGGGITAQSNGAAEYEEVMNKIYVPVS